MSSVPGSKVAATSAITPTYSRITPCCSLTSSRPARMHPESRPSCSAPPRSPLFRVQVPSQRLLDLVQALGHPQPGGMQRPPLIVIEDPAHRRAIVEHHGV